MSSRITRQTPPLNSSRPIYCPPSMASISQRGFIYELRPPPPLRVRNRPPSYDSHPSRTLLKYRKDAKRQPSPLVNCMAYDEVTLRTRIPVILTFPLASAIPEAASSEPVRNGFARRTSPSIPSSLITNSDADSNKCICFGAGVWPWLKDFKSSFSRNTKCTSNTLLVGNHYRSDNLPIGF